MISQMYFHTSKSGAVAIYTATEEFRNAFETPAAFQNEVVTKGFEDLLGEQVEVNHLSSGAPFIAHQPALNISISHSGNLIALCFSHTKRVGVDVQIRRDGLRKGLHYFVNEEEMKSFELTDRELLLIWSAKETVYKFYGGEVERYKEGMTVLSIGTDGMRVRCNGQLLNCHYREEERYILVYV